MGPTQVCQTTPLFLKIDSNNYYVASVGNKPGQVVVTSLTPASLGDLSVTVSSQRRTATEDELLGYKIELGRFTEDLLRKSFTILLLQK